MFNKLGYRLMLVASLLVLSACAEEAPEQRDLNAADVSNDGVSRQLVSIFDTAAETGTFNTLISALQTAGLDAEFADESKTFTVFAPTDAAFEKLGSDATNELFADPEGLKNLLQYHYVAEMALGSEYATGKIGSTLSMENGDNVAITHDGNSFWINSSEVIVTDVVASNGVIHVIDAVMIPPVVEPSELNIFETIATDGRFTILHQALVSTGLDVTLSNTDDSFTLLAPSDEAIAKLPTDRMDALQADTELLKNMVLYHVIAGEAVDLATATSLSGQQKIMGNGDKAALYLINGVVKVNEATVTNSNYSPSNGIIHELDSALTPPPPLVSPDHCHAAVGSIYSIARNTPDYSLFADAVEVANLQGAMGCPIDLYTVFLPTNSAFKALSQPTRARLFSDPAAMREVILMHVLPGRVVDSTVAVERIGFDLQTGSGGFVKITQQADSLWVNDAKIRTADVTTVNGIVHTIDKVLWPW